MALQRTNFFITGAAGTGKSYTVNKIYNELKHKYQIGLTAMTGCAAILLNPQATTLHSWAGIGLGKESERDLYYRILKRKKALKRWKTTDILIIDEVSMLGPILFEKLEHLGRKIRKNHLFFGGIQIIFVGDFFQLPPVEEESFLFESEIFQTNIKTIIELKNIYRQKDDLEWYHVLQNIRVGKLLESDRKILESRLLCDDTNFTCKLYPLNKMVTMENEMELKKLTDCMYAYKCHIKNPEKQSEDEIKELMDHFHIPSEITLGIGAQVMLTWNLDLENGLVNGSQGKIINFTKNRYPIIQFLSMKHPIIIEPKSYSFKDIQDEDSRKLVILQFPLKLSWALSIHKVQGHSLQSASMDLGNTVFECGQVYVALSRIQSLRGLCLLSFDASRIKVNEKVMDFYHSNAHDNLCKNQNQSSAH